MKWGLGLLVCLVFAGTAQAAPLTNRQETNVYRASLQASMNYGPPGSSRTEGQVGRCPVRFDGKVRCPITIKWRRAGKANACKVHVLLGAPGQNYGGYKWGKDARRCEWPLQPQGDEDSP